MNAFSPAPSILEASGCDTDRVGTVLQGALSGADDGELFLERSESEMLVFDDGRLKSANYDATEGFGLRVVAGETAGYAHSSEISEAAIKRAADSASLAKRGYAGVAAEGPRGTNTKLYGEDDPLASPEFGGKVALLQEIDAFASARDPRVVQVSASIAGERRVVEILRADGRLLRDVRPLVRVNVSVTVEKDGRRENGKFRRRRASQLRNLDPARALAGPGGRRPASGAGEPRRRRLSRRGRWMWCWAPAGTASCCTKRWATAWRVISTARAPPPFPDESASGWRRKGVTVIDDGSLAGRRGSLTIDDEGTPTERTVLIEDGILKGYMHDRMSARD